MPLEHCKSTSAKANFKMMMKLTPGVYFTNILRVVFCMKIPKAQKETDDLNVFFALLDLHL